MNTCWRCDKEVAESAEHCPYCGAGLSEQAINMMHSIDGSVPEVQIVVGVVVKDRYEIREKIGEGGMGVVYRAWDRTIERDVALKVIPQQLCLDPRAIAKLKQETSIALDLTHEHVVRLHTLDTWEGQAFVVMEYVGGGTLAHVLGDREKLSLEEALPYLEQIAEAIDYAHNASPAVVHRDLKPLNILVTEDGSVKVADFGLARALHDSASRISGHETAGTLAYMAPEQLRGKDVGRHTDIYALAAITYELLSGQPPFHSGDLRWQIMHEEADPISGLSDSQNHALQQALAKEYNNRPESAMQFLSFLRGETDQSLLKSGRKRKKKTTSESGKKKSFFMSRVMLGCAGALLLVVLGYVGFDYKNDIETAFRGGPLLTIDSEPQGATVFIDDGEVAKTPLTVNSLFDGTHSIRVIKEKYIPFEKKVFTQSNSPVQLKVNLVPEPFGDLAVSSKPEGADVFVDGAKYGKTPVDIEHLKKGMRSIEVKKEGYDRWLKRVDIKPLIEERVNALLISSYGTVSITSEPGGVEVWLGEQKIGVTPLQSRRTQKGEYELVLKSVKHEPYSERIVIYADQEFVKHAELVPRFGRLSITSTPPGADVFVNGHKIGATPILRKEVVKGPVELKVRKNGYASWSRKIKIAGDEHVEIQADMGEGTGELVVRGAPAGAELFIDGHLEGKISDNPIKIAAGKHKLEVKMKHYHDWIKTIEIGAGQALVFTAPMKVIVTKKNIFPVYGVTLGKTTTTELAKLGDHCGRKRNALFERYSCYKINGENFWYKNGKANHMYMTRYDPLPPEFSRVGFDFNKSYNQWLLLFKQRGYSVTISEPPEEKSSLEAKVIGRTRDAGGGRLQIELEFDYSRKKGLDTAGTLYSIRVRAL